MTVTLAFLDKGNTKLQEAGAWLVRKWTKSDYYHCEIIIGESWISSSSTDGVYINKLRPLNNKWKYVEIEVDEMYLDGVMEFLEEQEGKAYDWYGIIWAQIFKIERGHKQDEWFCSEIDSEILKRFCHSKITEPTATYSPGDLLRLFG